MAQLDAAARNKLDDSDFAYIDADGGRHLPINDADHVRAALARFDQTQFASDAAKAAARKRVEAAAVKFGIDAKQADEPSAGDVHADQPLTNPGQAPKRSPMLKRLMQGLRTRVQTKRYLSSEDLEAEYRSALGHAGGTSRKADEPSDMDICPACEGLDPADMPAPGCTCAACQEGDPDDCLCRALAMDDDDNVDPFAMHEQERRPMAEKTGVMVGYFLSSDTASSLAMTGGESPDELHVTLSFLGDSTAMSPADIQRAAGCLQQVCSVWAPIAGRVSGLGRFAGSDGSPDVLYASVDAPGLEELQNRVEDALKAASVPVAEDHGFVPHITLAYVPSTIATPSQLPASIPLTIDALTFAEGGKRTAFPLAGSAVDDDGTHEAGAPHIHSESGEAFRFFLPGTFAEAPATINYLPKPGTYTHPTYGKIEITPQRNQAFVANFQSGVYQDRLPIDAEHQTKLSGAVGWITGMQQNADGSVDASVDWTPRGRALMATDGFRYFSPEWYDAWQQPETGQKIENVSIGGAITTRPFFKSGSLRPLVANEAGFDVPDDHTPFTAPSGHTQELPIMADEQTPVTLTEDEIKRFREMESENAALRQAAEAAQTEARTAGERIAAIEAENRRRAFAEQATPWHGETASHVSFMEALPSDELREQYAAMQASHATALNEALKASRAFAAVGYAGGDSSAMSELEAKVSSIKASEPTLTDAQARARAWKQNPNLYRDFQRETAN